MSQHDRIIPADFQKVLPKQTSFLKKFYKTKKGVEVSIGVFCKQGGSPHNTKGLNTKIYQN